MVKDRLLKPDSAENGWLLDGYPRSLSQATALKELGFKPDIFILLEVKTFGYIASNISNLSASASL
jgi:adenylate kinase